MAQIHSFTADDTFALKENVRRAKTTDHCIPSLEEGPSPLDHTGITKTTAFEIERAENGNVRPEVGVGFEERWGSSI